MDHVPKLNGAAGYAALSICESLLLAMTDLEIMREQDTRDLLMDVAATHREAGTNSKTPGMHHAVVAIIERILAGKNSLPHH